MVGIYKITSPSEKVYIGQSIDVKRRFNSYKQLNCVEQIKLHRSLRKYGWFYHTFEILEECEEFNLNIRERYYQNLYNSVEKGLNCFLTNENTKNYIVSEESKKKMSESSKSSKIVIDVLSGIFYNSCSETARIFNIKENTLRSKLSGFKINDTQFEYIDRDINKRGGAFENISNYKLRKVINIKTGEIYNNIKEASIKTNIKRTTLYYQLNNLSKNKTNLRFYGE